jgi:protein-tyrosine phosphatase
MTPIVAHPERHRYFAEDPEKLHALVTQGAWLQITVDSLLGNHGREPKASAEELLRTYPDAVLSTDAHNLRRCSGLSVGYEWIREHLGGSRADELLARQDQILAALTQ